MAVLADKENYSNSNQKQDTRKRKSEDVISKMECGKDIHANFEGLVASIDNEDNVDE